MADPRSWGHGRGSAGAFLREVLLRGPVSRKEVAARLDVDQAQVSRVARRMIDAGLVRERAEMPQEGPVRPGGRFRLMAVDPRGGQVLGIVIAPTVQTMALADLGRNVISSTDFQFEPVADSEGLMERLAREFGSLAGAGLKDGGRLLGALAMVTGEVDPEKGTVLEAPYLGWGLVPLGERLAELLDMPVLVRRITPAIGQVEMLFGAARGRKHLLVMLCGTGIAAAVFVDGRSVGEGRFPAGAIGTMEVSDAGGKFRMLDDVAGGVGILRRLLGERATPVPLSHVDLDLHDAIERDRLGDPRVSALMADAGYELARLMAQHAHFINPELVLISGPLAMSPSYMSAIRIFLAKEITPPIEVAASRVTGPEGGWWSACSLAVHDFLVERSPAFLAS